MTINQQIIYSDKNYKILDAEHEFIIHPAALGLLPATKASLQCTFSSEFYIDNYCLLLNKLNWHEDITGDEKLYEPNELKAAYHGTIMIGDELVTEYYMKGDKPVCFSYQNVLELVFEDGMLVTTIDQSKAMLRIRKNIELGLRSLNKSRDLRCIRRFMNSSFIGDYKMFVHSGLRYKYLKNMKNHYKHVPVMYQ